MMADVKQSIIEVDEAGNQLLTYSVSKSTADRDRVDLIRPDATQTIWQTLLDVFLPVGFPHSVTEDYVEYVDHNHKCLCLLS